MLVCFDNIRNAVRVTMSSVCRWWPLILVMSCGVLVLNLGERCSRALGLTRFDFAAAAGDAPDDEHTESGRSLLRREQEASLSADVLTIAHHELGLYE